MLSKFEAQKKIQKIILTQKESNTRLKKYVVIHLHLHILEQNFI
jgi:hypothetical protein